MARTYEPIASAAAASASEVTFSNISGSFTDLVAVWGGTASGPRDLHIQFNSDTGSNYSRTVVYGTGSSAASLRTSSAARITTTVAAYPDTAVAMMVCQVMSYANTNVNKTALVSMAGPGVDRVVGLWRSTSAITSIRFYLDSGTFSTGTFDLYGIKAA